MDEPKEIYAQQLAKNSWALVVDSETLKERFGTAKEAVEFGREKYGIEPKARMLPKKAAKKGSKKDPASNAPKSGDEKTDETPEALKPNNVAKVHVDSDLRWPKAIREQLPLEPGDRWAFSIVSVSKTEFTVKAVKVEE